MEKLNLYTNKFLDYFPGFIFGIIAIIIGLTGDILAMSLYPGYSITKDMVSTLGVGPGAIYFNIGIFFSGLIAIPFYIDLARLVRNEDDNQTLLRTALISAIISCVTMAFVGIFPAIQSQKMVLLLHYLTAIISWLTCMIYCSIFSILMLRTPDFPKILAYFGFIPGAIILIYLFLIIFPITEPITPIIEWSIAFAIIAYIAINSLYMMYRKILTFNNDRNV